MREPEPLESSVADLGEGPGEAPPLFWIKMKK